MVDCPSGDRRYVDGLAADESEVVLVVAFAVDPKASCEGVEVGELRLPPGSSVALIVRDGRTLVPERRTVLRHGDDVLVVTPRKSREATERRLRSVSVGGRLAQWLGKKAPS